MSMICTEQQALKVSLVGVLVAVISGVPIAQTPVLSVLRTSSVWLVRLPHWFDLPVFRTHPYSRCSGVQSLGDRLLLDHGSHLEVLSRIAQEIDDSHGVGPVQSRLFTIRVAPIPSNVRNFCTCPSR